MKVFENGRIEPNKDFFVKVRPNSTDKKLVLLRIKYSILLKKYMESYIYNFYFILETIDPLIWIPSKRSVKWPG